MSTEQSGTTDNKSKRTFNEGFGSIVEAAKQFSATALAMIFIINGVGVGLYCFGLINPSKAVVTVFGAFSAAFAVYVLSRLVSSGVKAQLGNTKKRR